MQKSILSFMDAFHSFTKAFVMPAHADVTGNCLVCEDLQHSYMCIAWAEMTALWNFIRGYLPESELFAEKRLYRRQKVDQALLASRVMMMREKETPGRKLFVCHVGIHSALLASQSRVLKNS